MSTRPAPAAVVPLANGKLPVGVLTELLAELPPAPPELLLGPHVGEDACALRLPAGVLVAATDPVTLTTEEIGRWSAIVNANDVAVAGARPRWFLAVVLLPPGTSEDAVRDVFHSVRTALAGLGAHLVGGHTEVTPAVERPVVVGQMLGLAEDGRVVTSGGAKAGSVIVQVGAAPVEGASLLVREAADRLGRLEPDVLEAARAAIDDPGISIVEPALLAADLGAVAMHDPTEGGLAAGLHELAHASNVAIRVDRGCVLWFGPGLAVCEALGADPWSTLASGTLLAAFRPDRAVAARTALERHGYPAAAIGVAEPGSGVRDAAGERIPWPERDEAERLLASSSPSRHT
jgi:hydrogenase maturation factor